MNIIIIIRVVTVCASSFKGSKQLTYTATRLFYYTIKFNVNKN